MLAQLPLAPSAMLVPLLVSQLWLPTPTVLSSPLTSPLSWLPVLTTWPPREPSAGKQLTASKSNESVTQRSCFTQRIA